MSNRIRKILDHKLLRKYTSLVHQDLSTTYSRDLHKWLVIAPIIGLITGLLITLIAKVILFWMWPPVLAYLLHHWVAIIPVLAGGFLVAGLIMQYLTHDPDEHSTEEIIRSYHEHQGDIQMRPFLAKLVAAVATVGLGGSAALEGPSIYGGGALGSWLWTKLSRFRLSPRDRRIMLISGAAAGMAAVFRAPLTGLVFALEMPYKDDLAHEALLPSLISSVVSYSTLAAFLGATPVFNFAGRTVGGHVLATAEAFGRRELLWSALLGVICGLIAMVFDITFRRFRTFMVRARVPHWLKMVGGGVLTGACGLGFLALFPGNLVPLGPNYEAVGYVLKYAHSSAELVIFGVLKLAATLFSLGVGGVSAMFVPLFLTGGGFGVAFAQSVAHSSAPDLYAAVGMAAFIAGGYKTPLTAVVFVAEATGGHAYIVPTLIGAAVAYAISGEASVSGDQRLHEGVRVTELRRIAVQDIMQRDVIFADADSTVRAFLDSLEPHHLHTAYPVSADHQVIGLITMRAMRKVAPEKWAEVKLEEMAEHEVVRVRPDCDVAEALRLLLSEKAPPLLLVNSPSGKLQGVVTKTDILEALKISGEREEIEERAEGAV